MADDRSHSIRFKRGATEFEMTGSATEIGAAWRRLESAVVEAFTSVEDIDDDDGADVAAAGAGTSATAPKTPTPRKRTSRRRNTSGSSGGAPSERADVKEKLAAASMEKFPKVGPKPSARYAAFATLSWANKELKIDGLTAPEIATFMADRRRIKRSQQAFGQALSGRVSVGEVDVQGDPRVFRLMGEGETALAAFVAEQAKSGTGS